MKQILFKSLALHLLIGVALAEATYGKEPCDYPSLRTQHAGAITRFIAFGDSGSGSPEQYHLGTQMESIRKITDFRVALMLGDNLYPQGDVGQARSRFDRPYADLLKAGVNFYPVLGNHDLDSNQGRDEMAYFKMPGHWYSVLDGPTEFFMLDSNRTQVTYKQLVWLDGALSSSSAPWKVVAAHHPIYSSGKNGSAWWMRIFVEPILVKYKVNIVLSGHDHDYERIKPQRGVHYFVSGGGGGAVRPIDNPEPFSEVAFSSAHFLLFELGQRKGWFQAVNICGRVFDSGVLDSQVD